MDTEKIIEIKICCLKLVKDANPNQHIEGLLSDAKILFDWVVPPYYSANINTEEGILTS